MGDGPGAIGKKQRATSDERKSSFVARGRNREKLIADSRKRSRERFPTVPQGRQATNDLPLHPSLRLAQGRLSAQDDKFVHQGFKFDPQRRVFAGVRSACRGARQQ